MTYKILREIYREDRTRRVLIVERKNGSFGYEEEYFSQDPMESSWCSCSQNPLAICDSPETALMEAKGRIKWLGLSSLEEQNSLGLEEYYPGDEAFSEYSAVFSAEWDSFMEKEKLLKLVDGNVELARPIAYHVGKHYSEWLVSKVPALDDQTPLKCLGTTWGIRRLKTCLMRMP